MSLLTFTTSIATVLKRPSKIIKSPYVADIEIDGIEYLAHTPGLHLGGQIVPGSTVYVQKSKESSKTDYKIVSVLVDNTFVCAQPLYANYIFEKAVQLHLLDDFKNYKTIQREVKLETDHRVDFKIDDNFIEVKCVVCKNENCAIFPVGGQPKLYEGHKTISPRAIKHIKKMNELENAYIYFIILRNDCDSFKPNLEKDPYFCKVLSEADNVTFRCFDVTVSHSEIKFGKMIQPNLT